MKKYGNIRFTRRVVVTLCLLVVAVSVLMPVQAVLADTQTYVKVINIEWTNKSSDKDLTGNYAASMSCSVQSDYPVYSYAFKIGSDGLDYGFVSRTGTVPANFHDNTKFTVSKNGNIIIRSDCAYGQTYRKYGDYEYVIGTATTHSNSSDVLNYVSSNCDYVVTASTYDECWNEFLKVLSGGSSDYVVKYSGDKPTYVNNESIGYLKDVKLNLSYVTPIKGDNIFETTNYQIYSDLIYNLKWNSKKTSTNYDLSSSYVQLYAKCEYKDINGDKTVSDFIDLGDSEKASKGKLKFSFMELFNKSYNCKKLYLSDYPLSDVDYKNGKLQACTVTPSIQYKFYIRVYKDKDKGPWLCVTEKGSHHDNEFVNSGDDVKYNVSSGGLSSDGSFSPDGNVNENGTGTTGTGKDSEDADADTNANDKIQSKHDSSDNSVWDNLENLVSGIASVPIIIKDIFSFLPSWCLNVTATGFALMITVCIIRFIRGK